MFLGCGPTLQVKTDFDHHASFQSRSFRARVTDNTIVKDRVNGHGRCRLDPEGDLAGAGVVSAGGRRCLTA